MDAWFASLRPEPRTTEIRERLPLGRSAHGQLLHSADLGVVLKLKMSRSAESWCLSSEMPKSSGTYYSCLYALFDRERLLRDYMLEQRAPNEVLLAARHSTLGCQKALVRFVNDGVDLAVYTGAGATYRVTFGPLTAAEPKSLAQCED